MSEVDLAFLGATVEPIAQRRPRSRPPTAGTPIGDASVRATYVAGARV